VSFTIHADEPVDVGIRRIATDQVDDAIDALTGGEDDLHEGIHEARKSCKKLRGLVRLVRPALGSTYAEANTRFRDAARILSAARDVTAIIETFDDHVAGPFTDQLDDARTSAVRDALRARRDEYVETHDVDALVEDFLAEIRAHRATIDDWTLDAQEWDAIGPGLARTYGRARDRMHDAYAEGTTEAFHEWRKRVKYHRYHVDLLADMWEGPMEAWEDELHDLSDHLGDDHDLAVFRGVLEAEEERLEDDDVRVLVAVVDRRRAELQALARPLGEKLLAEEPGELADRLGSYWSQWRAGPPDLRTVRPVAVASAD
jgi:CHAD domain-containing protein